MQFFDIKPTYNQHFFIQDVQLHSTKISFEDSAGRPLTGGFAPTEPLLFDLDVPYVVTKWSRCVRLKLQLPFRRTGDEFDI